MSTTLYPSDASTDLARSATPPSGLAAPPDPSPGDQGLPPRAPDAEDIGSLLEPVLDRAYRAALYMTKDPVEAEDVVQDAALMALRGFAGFERGTNFRAWFLRIVTNAFLMRRRKERKSRNDVSLDEPDALFLYHRTKQAGLHDHDSDPGRTFFSRLTDEQIRQAIFDLPEQFRIVAAFYFVEDLSYQEIADIVGTPVGTVRSRLHRARAALQRRLWTVAVDYGIIDPEKAAGAQPA